MGDTLTPNLKLIEVQAGRNNWSDSMNQNLAVIDAVISAYFTVQNLQGVWKNSTVYETGSVIDAGSAVVYTCLVPHTSLAVPATFADERAQFPQYWGVYSSPARSRGVWTSHTAYALNDFVVSGSQYAICIQTNTSDDTFATDVASGYWSILVDLSMAGSSVLPTPGGVADANKFTVVNSVGGGYTIVNQATALMLLGATSIGVALLQATSSSAACSAIGAQVAGNYQPGNATLTALAGVTAGAYGLSLLPWDTLANFKASLGYGTAAALNVGVGPNNVVQLDTSSKLPAVDGSALTGVTGTPITPGTMQPTFDATAPSGWLFVAGGTFGNAASSGTLRANADTAALFTYLWTNLADAEAAVSGGRGVSAAADYAANKTITMPDMSGLAFVGRDNMSGTARGIVPVASYGKSQTAGGVNGETTHVLSTAELAAHTHAGATIATDGAGVGGVNPAVVSVVRGNDALGANITLGVTGSNGSGTAHNNLQKSMFGNWKIKL